MTRCQRLVLPAVLLACTLSAQTQVRSQSLQHWTGTWAASPCAPPAAGGKSPLVFHDETLRLVVHTSIGGEAVRIRLSNTFSGEPLTVGAAHLALRSKASEVMGGTDHTLTFSGRADVMVPAGASVLSDPITMPVPALGDVAVSLYLPGESKPGAVHYSALQTSYIGSGDQTAATSLQGETHAGALAPADGAGGIFARTAGCDCRDRLVHHGWCALHERRESPLDGLPCRSPSGRCKAEESGRAE